MTTRFSFVFWILLGFTLIGCSSYKKQLRALRKNEKPNKEKIKFKKQVGYQGYIEGGAASKYLTGDSISFAGIFSNGIHFRNTYLGGFIGMNTIDNSYIFPVGGDLRFTFTGNRYNYDKKGKLPSYQSSPNAFIFFNGGYSLFNEDFVYYKNSPFWGGGLGFCFGTQDALRMTLKFSYSNNNFSQQINIPYNSFELFSIKMGIEIRP